MWFHKIPDAAVLLRSKGVFYQKPLFVGPNRRLFAKWGVGYIRIGSGNATSCAGVAYDSLKLPFTPIYEEPLRNPIVPEDYHVAT